MTPTRKRLALREVLAGNRCLFPASVFDPVSARIAEDLGFEVGMFAGSVASLTVLGAPDMIVLTLSELAEQARRVCRAGHLPLVVDADHGYGNALNVARTVEELETAGIAALTIEDTALPMAYGEVGNTRLVEVGEGIGKMRAALAARQDESLVIAGRTSAASVTDIADAVARISAYQEAGVDMLMLVGVKTRADLDAIAAVARVPLMLGGAGAELMDADFLAERGVRICLTGHQPFMAAVRAVHETLKTLRAGTLPDADTLADGDCMDAVSRGAAYRDALTRYLGG